MATIFTDGFDSYAATSDLLKKWTANGGWTWNATAGVTGGGAIQNTSATPLTSATPIGTTNLIAVGFYFKISTPPTGGTNGLVTLNSASTSGLIFGIATSGAFTVHDGVGIQRQTFTTNWCDNKWHWAELRGTSNSGANVYVRIDDVVEFNGSIFYSGGQTFDRILFYGMTSATTTIDDVIVYDSASPSLDADVDIPIGPRVITTHYPSADSAVQFSRSAGADNYALVDDVAADDDSTYVQDNISGHQDLYEFGDLGFTPTTINGVMSNCRVKNPYPGAASISFKHISKSGATQTDGTSIALTAGAPTAYAMKFQFFNTDPNTAVAWTRTGFNSAKFGVKVV